MKPCTQLRAFASLDGGADVRRDLLSHARTCPSCAAWLVEEAELVRILDEKPPPIEPGSPVLQVRDVILGDLALEVRRSRSRGRGTVALAGGVCASLLLALSIARDGSLAASRGLHCALLELAGAGLVLGTLWLIARRSELPPVAWGAAAGAGALAAQAALLSGCPAHGLPHLLIFHVGTLALAAALATGARALALRLDR